MRDCFMDGQKIRFTPFIDGDVVNSADGRVLGGALVIDISLGAAPSHEIFINSTLAKEAEEGFYTAPVSLFGARNTILAKDMTTGDEAKIVLYRLPRHDEKLYRISSDDNIIFLDELTKGDYKSIFDHPYLAVYKKAHDLYGAKVHLNLFYEYCELTNTKFSPPLEYFNLSMVTDRYKDEWIKNSDWLKLAFHSKNETPHPYRSATRDEIREDLLAVHREIIRFAGAECLSDTTTIHYGAANLECARELRALGYRSLTGYFVNREDKPRVSYYLDRRTVEHVEKRDAWVDTEEDLILVRIDRVLNESNVSENREYLEKLTLDPHRGGFISIMIHEQYFYKNYRKHIENFEELVLDAAKLLYEKGYRGAHVSELTYEGRPSDYK